MECIAKYFKVGENRVHVYNIIKLKNEDIVSAGFALINPQHRLMMSVMGLRERKQYRKEIQEEILSMI